MKKNNKNKIRKRRRSGRRRRITIWSGRRRIIMWRIRRSRWRRIIRRSGGRSRRRRRSSSRSGSGGGAEETVLLMVDLNRQFRPRDSWMLHEDSWLFGFDISFKDLGLMRTTLVTLVRLHLLELTKSTFRGQLLGCSPRKANFFHLGKCFTTGQAGHAFELCLRRAYAIFFFRWPCFGAST